MQAGGCVTPFVTDLRKGDVMKGWQIFAHSLRLVFRNLDAALRVSLVPYLVAGVAMVFLALPAMRAMASVSEATQGQVVVNSPEFAAAGPEVWANFVLYLLIYTVLSLWIDLVTF